MPTFRVDDQHGLLLATVAPDDVDVGAHGPIVDGHADGTFEEGLELATGQGRCGHGQYRQEQ